MKRVAAAVVLLLWIWATPGLALDKVGRDIPVVIFYKYYPVFDIIFPREINYLLYHTFSRNIRGVCFSREY